MSRKMKKYQNRVPNSHSQKPDSHWRLFLLALLWLIGFGVIVSKLVLIQAIDHERYAELGSGKIKGPLEIPAQRGAIYDRNGEILAVDLVHYSLGAFPKEIGDKVQVARALSRIINESSSYLLGKMKSNDTFAYLAHRLRPQQADEIKELKAKGLVLEKKYSRYYPFGSKGAQVIGFCDFDNQAQSGIELGYDQHLKGIPGHAVYLRDARGYRFPDLNYPLFNPIDGKDVVTTIDIVFQGILEEELKKAILEHQAVNGAAILMNVRTGEILGLANYPEFDPNAYNKYPIKNYRNIAVSDQFEPGSTFKIIALALALEQLKMDLNSEKIFCENGRYTVFKKTIHDHKKFGYLSVREIFENSSNIGTIKLARNFDPPTFYRYARDFGFGTLTGVDLPAETAGILRRPNEYTRSSTSYMSIGYEVAATPLQIVSAYAAIANGGKLLEPFVVRKVVDDEDNTVLEKKPRTIRQVISAETARQMTLTLQGVVERGTGKTARVANVSIAGKTGTAQKLDHDQKRYVAKYLSSFVGFFPAESPRLALLIMINEPKFGYYGSEVAAPAFANIVRRIIGIPAGADLALIDRDYLYLEQNNRNPETSLPEPGAPAADERDYRIMKTSQSGAAKSRRENTPTEEDLVKQRPNDTVPTFIGLTLREALEKISELNMTVDVKGSGIVVGQYPTAGARRRPDTNIKLICEPS